MAIRIPATSLWTGLGMTWLFNRDLCVNPNKKPTGKPVDFSFTSEAAAYDTAGYRAGDSSRAGPAAPGGYPAQ